MGWFLAWQGVQWQAKIAAHKALFRDNTALVPVTLTQSHFNKIKAGKREVRLNGNLYDIKSRQLKGDSIHLVLYHDKREQALYDLLGIHFSQLENAPNGKANPVSFLLAQWLGAAFLVPEGIALPMNNLALKKAVFHWRFPDAAGMHSPPFLPPKMA